MVVWFLSVGLVSFAGFGAYQALAQRPDDDHRAKPSEAIDPPGQAKGPGGNTKSDPAEDAVAKELKLLQGDWRLIGWEFKGNKFFDIDFTTTWPSYWVFNDTRIDGYNGRNHEEKKMKFTIDPTKNPKHFDLFIEGEAEGRRRTGIYKLEDGVLTICVPCDDAPENVRPERFKTNMAGRQAITILKKDQDDSAIENAAKHGAVLIEEACKTFHTVTGKWPAKLAEVANLLENGKKSLIDPWGKDYNYAISSMRPSDDAKKPFVWSERIVAGTTKVYGTKPPEDKKE
jgi:uncharacterized protein (TIGR03067 family)